MFKKTVFIFLMGIFVSAHEGHHHHNVEPVTEVSKSVFEKINESYVRDIKPMFKSKCFDCHSSQAVFPWYQKIPGVKQWIQSDIDEARKHIDLESDFPFKSHASPPEDLEAIGKEIKNGGMPPMSYRIMHSGSALTDDEKEKVNQWVLLGQKRLVEMAQPKSQ